MRNAVVFGARGGIGKATVDALLHAEYEVTIVTSSQVNFNKANSENKSLKVHKQADSSPFEIEKNLRNKQNLIRENEVIVIIPSPSAAPTPILRPTEPTYKQWARLFFQ